MTSVTHHVDTPKSNRNLSPDTKKPSSTQNSMAGIGRETYETIIRDVNELVVGTHHLGNLR